MNRFALSILSLLLLCYPAAARPQWGLVPQEEPFLGEGKYTEVEGLTEPEGVRFILNDLTLYQPVVVCLKAKDPEVPVQIEMATEQWDQPHRVGETDAAGRYITVFRSAEMAAFTVKGISGAGYSLGVWVLPPQDYQPPSAVVSMAELEQGKTPSATPPEITPTHDKPVAQSQTQSEIPAWALVSLGFSGFCLLAVGLMFFQIHKMKSASGVIVLGFYMAMLGYQPVQAQDLKPRLVSMEQKKAELKELTEFFQALGGSSSFNSEFDSATGAASNDPIMRPDDSRTTGELTGNRSRQEHLDQRNRTRIRANRARSIRSGVQASASRAFTGLEMIRAAAEFLDPSVAPLASDFLPTDLPPAPTRSLDDNQFRGLDEFRAGESRLIKAVQKLEHLGHVYRTVMAKDQAFQDFASSAGSVSPITGIAVMRAKNDPHLAAGKAKFLATYDEAFNIHITAANEALLEMAACEKKHWADEEWYNRYGLPFYTYLHNRYVRR